MKKLTHAPSGAALLLFLFVTFALIPTPSAYAQNALDDKSEAWWDNLEAQITQSLDSPVEQIRDESLQNLIFFSTNYGDRVDFTYAVDKIFDIYENAPLEARRTLALVALHAVGNEYAMQRLSRVVETEPSARIQKHAQAVLADFYGRRTI